MNKKTIIILSILVIIIVSLAVFILQKQEDKIIIQNGDTLLFEKDEVWGPCPPDFICHQSTKLYYSGKLILEGATELQKQLEPKEINSLIEKIRLTNVMNKDCSAPIVVDYAATYKLTVNNQEKTIEFPGCEDELREIEELIPIKY